MVTKPEGVFPSISETEQLAQVGRLTPGELGLSRPQLASEAAIERLPESGQKPIQFRIAQAGDIESYLTNLFNKASGKTLTPAETTQAVVSSFNNYGKALSSKLRRDARVDFGAARSAGWFWNSRNLNQLADIGDLKTMTKKINGGFIGLDERIRHYENALRALGA